MSLENKIKRHNELERMNFRSDQEDEELLQLKEEIKLIKQDPVKIPEDIPESKESLYDLASPSIKINKETEKKLKRQRRTLLEVIQQWRAKRREQNKATPDEIRQLELEKKRAVLKRDIAEAKRREKDAKPSMLGTLLGSSQEVNNSKSNKGRSSRPYNNNDYKKFKNGLGSNDKDYSSLTG